MAMTETARLERETAETRARLEQTLGELRARMSPGQLLDQATDYLRNGSGRAFLGNLRDEVVTNPLPVALVGAGIAWLAISGAIGRRGGANGDGRYRARYGYDPARDWGRTAATADDLGHDGRGLSAAERARRAAEGWAEEARDTVTGVRESAREMGERVGTAYDEAADGTRRTAEAWADEASAAAHQAGERLREGMDEIQQRASAVGERTAEVYERTAGGVRRVARKAADYGRAARHAVQPDGTLMNFCREQPMLVAGLGIAIGAALGAMIPASRTERRVMGEASREVQDRVRAVASETMRAAAQEEDGAGDGAGTQGGSAEQPNQGESEGRVHQHYASGEAAVEFERGVRQGDGAANTESDPQSAPYAEAAEAGAVGAPSPYGEQDRQQQG